jgi:putative transposase
MERTEYSTDLTDKQWEIIAPLLIISSGSKAGRPLKLELREIINAILYLIHTGCQWRELPHDFPLWNSVYYHFSKYKKNQTWERIHREIHRGLREESGKNSEPSAAIIDSQSVKASQMVETKGFDGNKKVKGKKYHIVVDTIGFPLVVKVHDANFSDVKQAFAIMDTLFLYFATIKMLWADAAYRGELSTYLLCSFLCKVEIAPTLKTKGFQVVTKRWIVERTFGWFQWDRRLMIVYERYDSTSESMIYIASIGKMLRRYK